MIQQYLLRKNRCSEKQKFKILVLTAELQNFACSRGRRLYRLPRTLNSRNSRVVH
jgi:hypothetical protein